MRSLLKTYCSYSEWGIRGDSLQRRDLVKAIVKHIVRSESDLKLCVRYKTEINSLNAPEMDPLSPERSKLTVF